MDKPLSATTRAFDEALRALGYIEGLNVQSERRFAWGKQERLPDLAMELVRLDVDVIVTGGKSKRRSNSLMAFLGPRGRIL